MPQFYDNRIIGVPNRDFTPDEAARLGEQFGSALGKGSVVVSGRDYNPASRMLKRAFTSGLMSVGVEVMDFHESLSGEISFSIKRFGAKGGFLFTTSHSVKDSVMLKLFKSPGYELLASRLSIGESEVKRVGLGEIGWVMYSEYIHKLYVSALLSFVKVDEIITRGFRVVVHTAYSPADTIVPDVLKALEVDYVLLHNVKAKAYESMYPFTKELERVADIVRATEAEIGVVVNNDASSLVVLDEKGRILLPEELMMLITLNAPRGSQVIAETRVPGVFKELLASREVSVAEVGSEENLIDSMYKARPFIALRHTGHFAVPLFSLGYDALITLVKLLESLAFAKTRPSALVDKYRSRAYAEVGRLKAEEVGAAKQGLKPTIYGFSEYTREVLRYLVFNPDDQTYSLLEPRL